jgi:branched-chain amino acid transport system substrate-binding protein
MDKKIIFTILLFLTLINLPANTQTDKFDNDFNKAVQLYNSKDFEQALNIFNKITNNINFNSKTTISLLFKGKCLLHLDSLKEAETVLLKFIELYPTSNYGDEARLTLSKVYYEEKNYNNSFKELMNLIITSNSIFYEKYAKATGEKIAENYLLSSDVRKIYDTLAEPKVKPYLLLVLAKVNLGEGDNNAAQHYLQELTQTYPDAEEVGEAFSLSQKIKYEDLTLDQNTVNTIANTSNITTSLIGVILPLNGEKVNQGTASTASEILEGIKYAVFEYNSLNNKKIGIVIRNTGLEKEKIDSIKDEFENLPMIKAVIGPLFSNEVRIAINEFKDTDIPIISPTATDTGLTSINENFFQANPPFSLRGKVMADYIYYVENKRRLAVLNAVDGYSPLLASTFNEEFKKIGGEIFASKSYKSGSFSLKEPVDTICAFQDTLQGLYIPLADKIDVPAIFSQLIQDSTIVPIFGNQDWFYAKGFESAPALSEQLTFTSDYFIDYSDSSFVKFSRDFFNKAKIDPNRNVLYGYDVAKYLLTVMKNSPDIRSAVKSKMESGLVVNGFHNNISFDKNHINEYLNIVRYRNGKFGLIEKFKASD